MSFGVRIEWWSMDHTFSAESEPRVWRNISTIDRALLSDALPAMSAR